MIGRIDTGRRALVFVKLKSAEAFLVKEVEAWIDSGFTGDLVLHHSMIEELGLSRSGTIDGQLGDGTTASMDTYHCVIDWLGIERRIQVVSSKVQIPLLGAGILAMHRLVVDYRAKTLTIE